jgi:hypothetical protein
MKRFRRFFAIVSVSLALPLFSQSGLSKPDAEPLPEVLLSFEVLLNGSKVELSWASNADYHNNYFTIEKSKDGIAFTQFLKIRNFGNNSNIISYFDVDFTPYQGMSYYRLTQTNADGHTLSSRVLSVNNQGINDVLTLADAGMAEPKREQTDLQEALVVLRNEKGEESVSKVIVNGNDDLRISSDHGAKLNNGTYVIIASSDNKLYSKVVKIQ